MHDVSDALLIARHAEMITNQAAFVVRVRDDIATIMVINGAVTVRPPSTFAMKPSETPVEVTVGADQQLTISQKKWPTEPLAVDAKRESEWARE